MSNNNKGNIYDLFEDEQPTVRGKAQTKASPVSSVYTETEAFAMLFSRVVNDSKGFQEMIDLYLELEKKLLIATLHKASKDPDGFWRVVEEMKNLSDDDVEQRLSGKSSTKALQPLKAIQKALWNEGSSVVSLGLNPNEFSIGQSEIVKEALSDMSTFVQSIRVQKEMALDNFAGRLVACLPSQQQRQYETRQTRLTLLKNSIAEFTQGKFFSNFDISKFKLPTEAFLTVPTVLESRDALSVAVVRLLNSLYDDQLIIAFQEKDMNQIRMYTGGPDDYLLYDEDEDSPYAITRTPALYMSEVNNGVWKWRDIELLVNKRANLELSERGISLDNQYERDRIIKSLELMETRAIEEVDQIYFTIDSVIAKLPEVLMDRFSGKRAILRVFKRGYSTKDEVELYPEFLHICKKSIAKQFDTQMYPIVLADLNSVVLIPVSLWIKSRFHRTVSAQGSRTLYLTEHGMRMLSNDSEVLNFFFSMVQVSTLFAMLEEWENGKEFVPRTFAKKLITATVIDAKSSLTRLYTGPFSSLNSRKEQLSKFGIVATSTLIGCFIAPASSRSGKSMLEALDKNLKSMSEFEQYEQLQFFTNDELDMFGDALDTEVEGVNDEYANGDSGDESGGCVDDANSEEDFMSALDDISDLFT